MMTQDDPFGHVVTDKAAKQSSHMVERDGLYWTAKFMADATAAATASDPQWGLEGGMTPLAAVFASKWRQQVRAITVWCLHSGSLKLQAGHARLSFF
jgi:hypothetical protein